MGKEKRKVNYEFKLLYAIAIVFIVCGHCNDGGINIFFNWFPLYAFHLGIFMFASGYFYSKKDESHIGKSIWHKIKKIVIPLYLYNFFYAIVVSVSRNWGFSIGDAVNLKSLFVMPWISGHQFSYNLGSWFLVPLILIYLFHLLTQKLFRKYMNTYMVFGIYLILGFFGSYLSMKGIYQTWYGLMLARCLYMLPFYGFGILYREKIEHRWKIKSFIYFAVLFLIALIEITYYGNADHYTPAWCNDFNSIIRPHLIGFLGILFWLRICKILAPVIARKKIVLLLANNTFSIMINHFLGFMLVKTVFAYINKISYGVFFPTFDWEAYRSDLWYFYLPKELVQWSLVYVIAAIAVSLFIQYVINKAKAGAISCFHIERYKDK